MVGNDVVDLRDADARPESFRARFDERVFDAEERRAIARDPEPLARRWAHWAAKEAAFKLARQVDAGFVFTPGRLIATFEAPERGVAGADRRRKGRIELPRPLPTGERTLDLRSDETDAWVHVVAAPSDTDWGAVDFVVEEIDPGTVDASDAVRSLAVGAIARGLGVDAARLTIGREGRIPTVELDGERTALSISLSHHGAWVAYAMRLPLDASRPADAAAWNGRAKRAAGGAGSA